MKINDHMHGSAVPGNKSRTASVMPQLAGWKSPRLLGVPLVKNTGVLQNKGNGNSRFRFSATHDDWPMILPQRRHTRPLTLEYHTFPREHLRNASLA
jgi:hypothetical protein